MLKNNEWIDVIVEKTGCTKKEAKIVYDAIFDYMRDAVDEDNPVKISGFGTLKIRTTVAKEQVNLITGKPEIVPEHKVVVFKPAFEIDAKPEAIEMDGDMVINPAPVKPAKPAPAKPAKPAKPAHEEPALEGKSNVVWHYDGNECSENNIYQVLRQKTGLTDAAIKVVINKVKEQASKYKRLDVTVVEDNDSFQFVVQK